MARPPRLDLPDVAQHIVQRGNNRGACFFEDSHHRLYKALLREAAAAADVAIHAYAQMTNHIHLLATPRRAGGCTVTMESSVPFEFAMLVILPRPFRGPQCHSSRAGRTTWGA